MAACWWAHRGRGDLVSSGASTSLLRLLLDDPVEVLHQLVHVAGTLETEVVALVDQGLVTTLVDEQQSSSVVLRVAALTAAVAEDLSRHYLTSIQYSRE